MAGVHALGVDVLPAAERSLMQALPEPRVAVSLPPAQPCEGVAPGGEFAGIHPWMLLARHPVWRAGAARGLPLPNAVGSCRTHSGIAAEYAKQVARRLGVGVGVLYCAAGTLRLDSEVFGVHLGAGLR